MRTTMQAFKTTLNPLFTVGDLVYVAKLGICKVVEASRQAFTVMDSLNTLYEVNEVVQASQKARKAKHEATRGKLS